MLLTGAAAGKQFQDALVEWQRSGEPNVADVDIVYGHEIEFYPDMSPAEFKARLLAKASASTAQVLCFDIEDLEYIERNIEVVRQITREARRADRIVCWYDHPNPVPVHRRSHARDESDAIYVPVHRAHQMQFLLPTAIHLSIEHSKPLILQWSFRDLTHVGHLTLTEAASHLETFRTIASHMPLSISVWGSDHNAQARTPTHPSFRPEPRWGTWGYSDLAYEIETFMSSSEPVTRNVWMSRIKRFTPAAERRRSAQERTAEVIFRAGLWELRESSGLNGPHDGRRRNIRIVIDVSEVAAIIESEPQSVSYQHYLDTCRMFLLRGFSLLLDYPDRVDFPPYEQLLEEL
jgi:hypothetical protein